MKITDQINQDLKTAMLGGDREKADLLKMLKSALTNAKIAAGQDLDEAAVIKVLQKEAKSRMEAADVYEKAGSADRAGKERAEAEMIKAYLPAELSDDELAVFVAEAIAETGAVGQQDMGKVMGAVTKKVAGRADGSRVAALVKAKLAQ